MTSTETRDYVTAGGIEIRHTRLPQPYRDAAEHIRTALDDHRGVLLTSSFEYPGRYTRWDIGLVDPPLEFVARARNVGLRALNPRGRVLLDAIADAIRDLEALSEVHRNGDTVSARVREDERWFPEELRSRQPTVFSVLRRIIELFHDPDEHYLGFYGAFGYELAFQFEATRLRLERNPDDRDLVLYLPDRVLAVDHRREAATVHEYEFLFQTGVEVVPSSPWR